MKSAAENHGFGCSGVMFSHVGGVFSGGVK